MPKNIVDTSLNSENSAANVSPEKNIRRSSKQELLRAMQKSEQVEATKKTVKSPSQILQFIEENNETIESLAKKAEVSEREFLLAIRDGSDTATRKKIAEALQTTYYSIFGK